MLCYSFPHCCTSCKQQQEGAAKDAWGVRQTHEGTTQRTNGRGLTGVWHSGALLHFQQRFLGPFGIFRSVLNLFFEA